MVKFRKILGRVKIKKIKGLIRYCLEEPKEIKMSDFFYPFRILYIFRYSYLF